MNRDTYRYHEDRANSLAAPASSLAAVVLGLYFVYLAADLIGFPVRRWVHDFYYNLRHFAHMAATQLSPLLLPAPSPAGSDDQQEGSPTSPLGFMSGMFGLNSGGLINKGVRGVGGLLSRGHRNVPAGLGNWDNSCYQNSVIQGLASLPSLREYLSNTTSEYSELDPESTSGALFELINKLNDPENHGQHFWIRGKLKSMSTFQQQDAQEYYSKILDALDNEVKKVAKSKRKSSFSLVETMESSADSDITAKEKDADSGETQDVKPEPPAVKPNPLDGLLAQRVGCVACGYTEGLSLIPFNCLTVPLGREWSYDIADCLNEYTDLEYIEGVECAKCTLLKLEKTLKPMAAVKPDIAERLRVVQEALDEEDFDDKAVIKKFGMPKKFWAKSTKSRQAVVARAPKSLVIHVNRSIFDEMSGHQYKNNANVIYPRILDLGNWCLGSGPSNSTKLDEEVEEAWPRDPKISIIGGKRAEQTAKSPFQYALKAAVTHFGGHGSGHYICYRQHPFKTADEKETDGEKEAEEAESGPSKHQTSEDQWWRLSDESVGEVSEDEATRQSNVFMLFYERIDADASPEPAEAQPVKQTIATATDAETTALPVDASLEALSFEFVEDETPDTELEKGAPHTPVQLLTPPSTPGPSTTQAIITPNADMTDASETTDADGNDSDGAPSSTTLTSDDDVDMLDAEDAKEAQTQSPSQPRIMRTAGDGPGMADGERNSLPMVRA